MGAANAESDVATVAHSKHCRSNNAYTQDAHAHHVMWYGVCCLQCLLAASAASGLYLEGQAHGKALCQLSHIVHGLLRRQPSPARELDWTDLDAGWEQVCPPALHGIPSTLGHDVGSHDHHCEYLSSQPRLMQV